MKMSITTAATVAASELRHRRHWLICTGRRSRHRHAASAMHPARTCQVALRKEPWSRHKTVTPRSKPIKGSRTMDERIKVMSRALETLASTTDNRQQLARDAIASNPEATMVELRRAALYAITDPDRRDYEV